MSDIAIGIIGTGAMGTRHAMNVQHSISGARVAAVYDLDQQRAQQVATDCGGAQVFAEPMALIRDAAVEAVLIVSPDPTHAAFVQACLQQRKPVLCEKPLATTAADALAIIEAEQKLGHRLISVGFMRRFDPYHVAVKEALESGQIGRAMLFKGVHRNPTAQPNITGATVISNSASHDIDAMRWLMAQEVTEVYVRGVRTHATFSAQTLDMIVIQMTLTGGSLATIECSVAVEYGYEVAAEIVGQSGSVSTGQPANAIVRAQNVAAVAVAQSHLARFQPAFIPEITDWLRSLRTGQTFAGASAWDGYMASLIADACVQSLGSGLPVSLQAPARPDFYNTEAVKL